MYKFLIQNILVCNKMFYDTWNLLIVKSYLLMYWYIDHLLYINTDIFRVLHITWNASMDEKIDSTSYLRIVSRSRAQEFTRRRSLRFIAQASSSALSAKDHPRFPLFWSDREKYFRAGTHALCSRRASIFTNSSALTRFHARVTLLSACRAVTIAPYSLIGCNCFRFPRSSIVCRATRNEAGAPRVAPTCVRARAWALVGWDRRGPHLHI